MSECEDEEFRSTESGSTPSLYPRWAWKMAQGPDPGKNLSPNTSIPAAHLDGQLR